MTARSFGEIANGIIARAAQMAKFQNLIADCATPASRKKMIMTARIGGLIDDQETALLIEIYGLESV